MRIINVIFVILLLISIISITGCETSLESSSKDKTSAVNAPDIEDNETGISDVFDDPANVNPPTIPS